jgi:hypothetical protein
MSTLLETSSRYAAIFINTRNKKYAVKRITNDINDLVFSVSKQPLDLTIKITIVQVINEIMTGIRPVELSAEEILHIKSSDTSKWIKHMPKLLEQLQIHHQPKEKELYIQVQRSDNNFRIFNFGFL